MNAAHSGQVTEDKVSSADLDICAQEPIHSPSAIQPYGMLIACRLPDLRVLCVSANSFEFIAIEPAKALEGTLYDLVGLETTERILATLSSPSGSQRSRLTFTHPNDPECVFHAMAHRVDDVLRVEIERSLPSHDWYLLSQRMEGVVEALKRTGNQLDLCTAAVEELRTLTGFDHVMIYRFHADNHGEVIAESKVEDIEPSLNLHFPASDIPDQARKLYSVQRVRLIADVDYTPVPLQQNEHASSVPLDMTSCSLRSISPIHLQYLRNMGRKASFSVSLVHGNRLWGLIICLHRTPMLVAPQLRSLCDLLGQIISMLTEVTETNEDYVEALLNRGRIRSLATLLNASDNLSDVLMKHCEQFLESLGASGAMLRLQGQVHQCGVTPELDRTLALARVMKDRSVGGLFASDNVSEELGLCEDLTHVVSGALFVALSRSNDDCILWLRPEISETVRWAGNPYEAKMRDLKTGLVGPRQSFVAWCALVSGRARRWTHSEVLLAQEIRQIVTTTFRRHSDARQVELSYLDSLTSLPNRRVLLDRLGEHRSAASGPGALLFIDIDRFKAVNDTYGHSIGDELLIQVARRLRECAGHDDLVARLGGDEFVVFSEGVELAQAASLAEKIIQGFKTPFSLALRTFRCTLSIGVAATFGKHIHNVTDILNAADSAMYEAKHRGGNQSVLYRMPHPEKLIRDMQLEQELFQAIERGEMEVNFQPQVTVSDNRLVGFEALLRWRHPRYGAIPPCEFIGIAEKVGYIRELGRWVLKRSLEYLSRWRQIHDPCLFVAVNVSVKELVEEDFVEGVATQLDGANLPASSLHLEITESVLMQGSVEEKLAELQLRGVKIVIDDFGTGYSSLSYLQRLPVSKLKLDRTFLEGVGDDPRKTRLFSSIVGMAHSLELEVVAEGIETISQLNCIRDSLCDEAQGFFLSHPLPAPLIEQLLSSKWVNGLLPLPALKGSLALPPSERAS
jgi:diguanylate cyclase (GGDEF)-like protein